jgi:uncharacterized protein
MQIYKDVDVPSRDGSPIAADVFRPDGDAQVPVIATISPYGKDVHWAERFPMYDRVEQGDYMVWETPNPEWWTERGYAVVRADTRGTGKTQGPADPFSKRDAEDYYDLIEWCGTQSWSNGKVATSGISWFGMMGWLVAALQPPHLAAVVAWEGLNDLYREWAHQGGLYTNRFTHLWVGSQLDVMKNTDDVVDWREEFPQRELLDDWYRERIVDLSRIETPLLSAGNWGSTHLHLRGNIEGYLGVASKEKWLIVYTGTHVDPYYADWAKALQLRFLDTFLKDGVASMDDVAPVRLVIRKGRDSQWRDEQEWPLAGTEWSELYLGDGSLSWEAPPEGRVAYPANFDLVANAPVELTGPIALRLWVAAEQDDFDVIAWLDQYDSEGQRIEPMGPHGPDLPIPSAMGWLRASHRKLDAERTLPYRPWHSHDELQPLVHGEPTLLEVEIWPTSLTLAPGDRLRLELRTTDTDIPGPMAHDDPTDAKPAENVSILVGGAHASHLLVPVIPARS